GEVVAGRGDFEFEVVDADPRRVTRVKITRGRGLIAKPARHARRKDEEEEVAPLVDGPAPKQVDDRLPVPVTQPAITPPPSGEPL
ncbi:hypothetical protein ABTE27_22635, partial [Acinetobacter baumannii]